jgi:hypothetical protein
MNFELVVPSTDEPVSSASAIHFYSILRKSTVRESTCLPQRFTQNNRTGDGDVEGTKACHHGDADGTVTGIANSIRNAGTFAPEQQDVGGPEGKRDMRHAAL